MCIYLNCFVNELTKRLQILLKCLIRHFCSLSLSLFDQQIQQTFVPVAETSQLCLTVSESKPICKTFPPVLHSCPVSESHDWPITDWSGALQAPSDSPGHDRTGPSSFQSDSRCSCLTDTNQCSQQSGEEFEESGTTEARTQTGCWGTQWRWE